MCLQSHILNAHYHSSQILIKIHWIQMCRQQVQQLFSLPNIVAPKIMQTGQEMWAIKVKMTENKEKRWNNKRTCSISHVTSLFSILHFVCVSGMSCSMQRKIWKSDENEQLYNIWCSAFRTLQPHSVQGKCSRKRVTYERVSYYFR